MNFKLSKDLSLSLSRKSIYRAVAGVRVTFPSRFILFIYEGVKKSP